VTKIAVHVDKDGYPDGGYATVYGECNPKDGWYEVTMDPLMNLDLTPLYKIDSEKRLVYKETGLSNFDEAKDVIQASFLQTANNTIDINQGKKDLDKVSQKVTQNANSVSNVESMFTSVMSLVSSQQVLISNLSNRITALENK